MLVRQGDVSGPDAFAARSRRHQGLYVPLVFATGGTRVGGGSQLRWLMSLIWKDRVMDGGMKKVFVIGIGAGNPDYVAVQVIARLTKWTCSLLWTRGRIKNS